MQKMYLLTYKNQNTWRFILFSTKIYLILIYLIFIVESWSLNFETSCIAIYFVHFYLFSENNSNFYGQNGLTSSKALNLTITIASILLILLLWSLIFSHESNLILFWCNKLNLMIKLIWFLILELGLNKNLKINFV